MTLYPRTAHDHLAAPPGPPPIDLPEVRGGRVVALCYNGKTVQYEVIQLYFEERFAARAAAGPASPCGPVTVTVKLERSAWLDPRRRAPHAPEPPPIDECVRINLDGPVYPQAVVLLGGHPYLRREVDSTMIYTGGLIRPDAVPDFVTIQLDRASWLDDQLHDGPDEVPPPAPWARPT